MVSTQDLGPVTAYAIAVKYGFSGTEEEWANAVDAQRQAASASATSAANSASEALTAANSAKASAASISSSVISANSSANSAKNSSDSAIASATSAANSLAATQNTVAHMPVIGDNGNWQTYNGTAYEDTGKPSQGVKGDKGDIGNTGNTGEAATIAVGTITTLPAGSNAVVTNTGTTNAAILNFGIPKGADGSGGITQEQADGLYAKKYSNSSVTLATASWVGSSAPFTQDIILSGVTNSSVIGILPSDSATVDNRSAWRSALISGVAGADKITIIADGNKPSTDIPMSITVWG